MLLISHIFAFPEVGVAECTEWSELGFSCSTIGEPFNSLNISMNTTQADECKRLCRLEGGTGCCMISDDSGCHWKEGSVHAPSTYGKVRTMTCSFPGK